MTEHELKTLTPHLVAVIDGSKTFEIRRNDRDFKVGDTLHLLGWDGSRYTGSGTRRRVTYVLSDAPEFGLMPGFAILGLAAAPVARDEAVEQWRWLTRDADSLDYLGLASHFNNRESWLACPECANRDPAHPGLGADR